MKIISFVLFLAFLFPMVTVCIAELSNAQDIQKIISDVKSEDEAWTQSLGAGKGLKMKSKVRDGMLEQNVLFRSSSLGKISHRFKSGGGQTAETVVFEGSDEANSVTRVPVSDGKPNPWAFSQSGDVCYSAIFTDERVVTAASRIDGIPLTQILGALDPKEITIRKEAESVQLEFAYSKGIRTLNGMNLPFIYYPAKVQIKLDVKERARILELQVKATTADGKEVEYGFTNEFQSSSEFKHEQFAINNGTRQLLNEARISLVDAEALRAEELTLEYYGVKMVEEKPAWNYSLLVLCFSVFVIITGAFLKYKSRS